MFQAFNNHETDTLLSVDEDENIQDIDDDGSDSGTDINLNDEDDEIISIDVFEALHGSRGHTEDGLKLPKHFRCAAHTISLVGDVNLHKVNVKGWNHQQMNAWERMYSKCQAIWTRQSRSPTARKAIKEIIGKLLRRPALTRWNSIIDSFIDIVDAVEDMEQKIKFKEVIESFKGYKSKEPFKFFTNSELDIMKAYVEAFKPIASALDTIQGETMIYGGMLLPTIHILESNLEKVKNNDKLKYMKPIVTFNLLQIRKRFKVYLDDDDLYLATAFHPFFKLASIRKMCIEKLDHIQTKMVDILLKFAMEDTDETVPETSNTSKKPTKNFFDQMWETSDEDLQEV